MVRLIGWPSFIDAGAESMFVAIDAVSPNQNGPPALILQGADNFLAFFQKGASKFEINRVIITPLHRGALAQLVEQRTLKSILPKDKKSSAFCLPIPSKKTYRHCKILRH